MHCRMNTTPLLQHLDAFVGFARSRTGDPELAADLVQECLMKALKADNVTCPRMNKCPADV
jgi:DNA-directed RNA polymerase specialized sigma24 family protein